MSQFESLNEDDTEKEAMSEKEEKDQKDSFYDLERKCQEAHISITKGSNSSIFIDLPVTGKEIKRLRISRSSVDKFAVNILANTNFEKFNACSNYKAIWSSELKTIEATLKDATIRLRPVQRLLSRFQNTFIDDQSGAKRVLLTSESDRFQNIRISLGPVSSILACIDVMQENNIDYRRISPTEARLHLERYPDRFLSIKIENVEITNHDHACRILERIANSVLLQLDDYGMPMHLANEEMRPIRQTKLRAMPEQGFSLSFPEYQYPTIPTSLYWYATTAIEMPLLQYLAYYQVIEYFFPFYAARKTNDIIKGSLKNPSFLNDLDENITKLVAMIKPYMGKGGYADERASIKAVLEDCLSTNALKRFLESNESRKNFFSTKSMWKIIANQNIFSENPKVEESNLVINTALRIYEIRCRIVHTKSSESDGHEEPLLPFSKGTQNLYFDIELVKFIAKEVLVHSGQQLNLH